LNLPWHELVSALAGVVVGWLAKVLHLKIGASG